MRRDTASDPRLDERVGNVDVRRVAIYPQHDESAVRRAANYTSFGLSAMAFGIDALRGLDALWVNYSPITVAWPMWAARYGLRIPSVVHVLDLWPDTVLAGGLSRNRTLFRAVSAPAQRVVQRHVRGGQLGCIRLAQRG